MTTHTPSFLGAVMKHIACTPNKNTSEEAYDKGVIEPTSRIRQMQRDLGEQRPTDAQIVEVMHWLLGILETKQVEMEEREDRIRELIDRYELSELFPDLLPLKRR